MRDRVQSGLARNRMPDASCATLIMPASVSSFDTITRASLSSCLMPSAWMGPARITRGFMDLLSEVECHLGDAERRVGLEHIPPPRVHEAGTLVQPRGGAVALGHPQLEPVELARPGPVDGRGEQRLAGPSAAALRLHPHAADVAGLRPVLVEEPEDEPEWPTLVLRHEHDLSTRRRHRLGEADPVGVGLRLLVGVASREGIRRVGQRAESQLAKQRPLATFELADPHAWPPASTCSPRARCAGSRERRMRRTRVALYRK